MVAAHHAGWLRTMEDPQQISPELAGTGLDDGERSAIALALAFQSPVLVDDRRGRMAAKALGLHVLGTLGLLVRARDSGLLTHVRPLVDALLATGYYLSRPLVERTLAAIGE